ncbi:hypothetical protein RN001_008252 [Aquatica leii]|uniref:Nose resistant-to-fluoxetine protein N-terminal domain-containing protein n=1 Tax=Aquatica leii TaxID=1421715 RepID=A0AAN7PD29_9COLE|nr:hypothetical protein RN001_008252 [Aquatica leii]
MHSPSIYCLVVIILIENVASGFQNTSKSSMVLNAVIDGRKIRLNNTSSVFGIVQDFCTKNATCTFAHEEGTATFEQTLTRLITNVRSHYNLDLSAMRDASTMCKLHSMQYADGLGRFELWALKMHDASAKIPSGLLNGNVNQLGDFDMCLSVREDALAITGQYCLASLQVHVPKDQYLKKLHRLLHSHYMLKSNLHDPGHRVPRFSSINWALCVPSSCNAKDVELGVRSIIDDIVNGTNLQVEVAVDPIMCQTGEIKEISIATYVACALFLVIILLAVASTVYDLYTDDKRDILVAFSLRKNVSALFSTERTTNDIESVHGIRFINAFMLVISHKSMALFFIPYMNRTNMSEIMGKPWTVFGRAASLYTDPFIMISGTLTTYYLLKKLRKQDKINVLHEYASRLFRIIPTLGALILFCTFILPLLSTGPNWNLVVTQHADNCKKYWWRNLLFIHNYFGFKNMCLTHTHHVGIDTQLFFASVLTVPFLWKWPRKTFSVLTAVAVFSTGLRYHVTYSKNLSNYIHFGTSIEQLFDTADNMYILPIHRVTVYIMGMLLAYLLLEYKQIQFSKMQLRVGDALALFSFCVAFFGPSFMGSINYTYNPVDAAWYAAFAPIFWCFTFAWIIFTSHIKQAGIMGKILSNKLFLVTTRLSYAIYLTQFPIFFYNVGVTRTPENYNFISKTFNIAEWLWIIFFSIVLTVLFETPFQNIRNIVFKKDSTTKKAVD